tara:strand:+ start:7303 stop:7968 length:666 start_codon:yes stop_codon:yes gene_type:complete
MTEQVEELTRGEALARVAVLEAELAELRKRVCVPEGCVVVPVEPTIDMSAAARRAWYEFITFGKAEQVYRAMLAAAPAPVERLATDGGRNQRFEGLFEGETPDQRDARLASAAPVERVEQDAVAMLLIDDATAAESGDWDIEPIPAAIEKLARSGGAALPLYTTPQPAPTAAQGVAGLVSVLAAVQEQFKRYGQRFPDGFDGRVFRWVDDALAAHQSGGAK